MSDVICGHQRPSAAIRGTHTCFSSAFRRLIRRRTGAHHGKPIASQTSSLRRTTRSSSHVFSVRYPRTCGELMTP